MSKTKQRVTMSDAQRRQVAAVLRYAANHPHGIEWAATQLEAGEVVVRMANEAYESCPAEVSWRETFELAALKVEIGTWP